VAHHLQKVIILSLALGFASATAAAPPKRPFSHKFHMTQVPQCESCHTAATTSTKADDILIPHESTCATCHDEVHISPARPTGVQGFNHAKHVEMGSVAPLIAAAIKNKTYLGAHPATPAELDAGKDACTGCHHGIAESENVPAEKATKAHFPAMADCLVCHNKISPPDSCAKCHVAPNGSFKPTTHDTAFSDNHATKAVAKMECANCHGRKFTCKGCH
jgi:hypothetical protein